MQAKGLTNDSRYHQLCYLLQQAEQKEQVYVIFYYFSLC